LLVPVPVNDSRNVILELKPGAGGAEAQLFASELLEMYQNYASEQGWRVEVISLSESEVGGLRVG
jgi:peptide chain release factor 1